MRLDQALVTLSLCESRTEAQELIDQGFVTIDGTVITKRTKQVLITSVISVAKTRQYVSRGGHKLQGAMFDVFSSSQAIFKALKDKSALDVGSSTGGFTDFLLQHGVATVCAVDVGTAQLHKKILQDERVCSIENTNILDFKTDTKFDYIVGDLSFVPLERVFDTVIDFGMINTRFFLLIKPQFEVGKGNTKKGIVRDHNLVLSVLKKYEDLAHTRNLLDISIFPCKIEGGDGNQEYFLYAKRS